MNQTHTTRTRYSDVPSQRFRTKSTTSSFSSSMKIPQDFDSAKTETATRRRIEEIAGSWACLVDKWMMEKEANDRFLARKMEIKSSLHENNRNNNNDSSSSSSSAFGTSTSSSSDSSGALSEYEFLGSTIDPKVSCFSSLKSRSKAVKACDLKQPISPGMRLTNFINSIFTNANGKMKNQKKKSNFSKNNGAEVKYFPKVKEQRRVRFLHPESVILDVGCDKFDKKKPAPSPPERAAAIATAATKSEFDSDADDDAFSDCSSDLFEIDHLAIL